MVSEKWVTKVILWFPGADSKACFTFFAMCAEDGNKLPLMKCGIHPVDGGSKI
jgi:hypothetical protein